MLANLKSRYFTQLYREVKSQPSTNTSTYPFKDCSSDASYYLKMDQKFKKKKSQEEGKNLLRLLLWDPLLTRTIFFLISTKCKDIILFYKNDP